jgi:transcriptional regulator with GAF, ATPase, and Fis domain
MPVDRNNFFRNATLKICGSLNIDKALWHCLLYIQDFIPVGQMSLSLYDQKTGVAEIVAHSTAQTYRALSITFMLNEDLRRQVKLQVSSRVRRLPIAVEDRAMGIATKYIGCENLPLLVMDLVIEKEFLGVVALHGLPDRQFNDDHGQLLEMLNEPFSIALANHLRIREIQKFQNILKDDNRYLQEELRRISGDEIIGADFGLKAVMDLVRQVAPQGSPVLLLGETGVGKELLANALHNLSPRREGPLITVNCGAIPESLMDSELFGHDKGAFTGAVSLKRGRFERANHGTIFLDEIGELSPEAQIRLLRVLQEKEIERVGGSTTIPVDIRVVAATHRDLNQMVASGRFRNDLYFRLKVFPVEIPPLRSRADDIPALVQHFIKKKCREMKLERMPDLAPGALEHLQAYPWPGNIRELENAVERELILNIDGRLLFNEIDGMITKTHTPALDMAFSGHLSSKGKSMNLDQAMAEHIRKAMDIAKGKVEGKGGAAEHLGINPRTLRHRMKKLGIPFGRSVKNKYIKG